jgi:class 3 adenylate cyclase
MEIRPVKYARSGDIGIAYQEFGRADGPRLVFISGFISHLDLNWEAPPYANMLRGLGAVCRVAAFDKRGTGLSDRDLGFGSVAERMDDVRAVLDALRWSDAHLFGISEGGPIALLFAATYPDRVNSLTLYGTAARFRFEPGSLPSETFDPEPWLQLIETGWGSGHVLIDGGFLAHSELPSLEFMAKFERSACTPKMARTIMRRNLEIDVRPILSSITVPTLVLHATGETLVPLPWGRYLADHVEGARFVEIPRNMHLSWLAEDYGEILSETGKFVSGGRDDMPSERVLATVLFTDIVKSTEQAAALGDRRWRELLERHDAQSAADVARYGGRLVKSTGDGMLATFDGPARAVQCARALIEGLAPAGIPLRAGLHTGEIERRGDDVAGIGVHIAARVADQADDGEVLVSRTVRDLVVGSDLKFDDRGTHELKGVPEEWQLYAAVAS